MKEMQSHLEKAIKKLPQEGYVFSQQESRIETRVVRGYKNKGERNIVGVYNFIQRVDDEGISYILTHDTLSVPVVIGVLIRNGEITKIVGADSSGERAEGVVALFNGFNSCEQYRYLSDKCIDESRGIHNASSS